MKCLFDSDHVSILLRPTSADFLILSTRIDQHSREDFGISVVSFHEQIIGCHSLLNRAKRQEELVRGYALLQDVLDCYSTANVVPFDPAAIKTFEEIKGHKTRAGIMDLRIAATAISRGATLLTRNRTDFENIPGLVMEDWTV